MNMRKRILLAGCIGLGALGASAAVLWFTLCARSNPGVTLENARRIQSGMTLEEVQAIFGEPGEEWRSECPGMFAIHVKEKRIWKADGLAIGVKFGYGSRFDVIDMKESGAYWVYFDNGHSWEEIKLPLNEPPTQFERLRHWLSTWRRSEEPLCPEPATPEDPGDGERAA
jgi:hypothetical protein